MGRETPVWARPFVVLYKFYVVVVLVIPYILCFPVFYYYLFIKPDFKRVLRIQRGVVQVFAPIAGLFLIPKGLSNFPEPPYIVTPNHSSYLDIIMMFALVPHHFVFMGKSELESWPIFNIHFTSGQNISVNRRSARESTKSYQMAKDALDQKVVIVIFPEATIPTDTPNLKNFKSGAFKLAIECGVPVVPVVFHKNYIRLRSGGFFKALASPGFVPVTVHWGIETKGMKKEQFVDLRNKVKTVIEKTLDETAH